MAVMNVQGIGISPYDLTAGAEFLRKLAHGEQLPLLSANLIRRTDNKLLFPSQRIVTVAGIRIALVGLTGPLLTETDELTLKPWQEVLSALLPAIEKKCDLVILLSSMPRQVNEQIAARFPSIHILLQAGRQGGNQPPTNINNTLLCQTGGRGKYLGIMDIGWNKSKKWQQSGQQDPATLQQRLDRITWQLERMRKRYSAHELSANTQYQRLENEKTQLTATLAVRRGNGEKAGKAPCTWRNIFLAMDTSLPQEREVQAIVDSVRQEVNQVNRELQQEQRRINEQILQTFAPMASAQRCKECHPSQVAFYLRTAHARAWQTLVQRDQQYNPDCIACHATLPDYGTATVRDEALLTALPDRFQNVGCETCHGPSLAHANDPDTRLPSRPVVATCRRCHTEKRDPAFDYERKLPKIRCPTG